MSPAHLSSSHIAVLVLSQYRPSSQLQTFFNDCLHSKIHQVCHSGWNRHAQHVACITANYKTSSMNQQNCDFPARKNKQQNPTNPPNSELGTVGASVLRICHYTEAWTLDEHQQSNRRLGTSQWSSFLSNPLCHLLHKAAQCVEIGVGAQVNWAAQVITRQHG